LYASFTVNFGELPTSSGSYFAHFKDNSTGYRARVWASTTGALGGSFRLGIGNSSSATATSGQLTNNLSLNTTYTVVARYNVGTGVSTIWLNSTAESDPSVTASDTPGPINITSYAFRQNSGMGTLLVDELKIGTAFGDIAGATNQSPVITMQPTNQVVGEGGTATFSVIASGTPPLSYQWHFNGTNLAAATNASLTLTNVLTNQAGSYSVTATNTFGSTNSQAATLTVNIIAPYQPSALSILTYNVKGNGATNWSTNAPQVQAIARKVQYLNPDIITFQEIPFDLSYEMTNFVNAFLPGYALARNSGTDGSVRSVIASRFPITRSTKWLDGASLVPFGYTNSPSTFTRDLFEAEIAVLGLPQPLHVFTTHLKATTIFNDYTNASIEAARRAAEAACISNFFVTGFLTTNALRPYILTGDMNEDIFRPATNVYATGYPIQKLVSPPTGLQLTTPTNPVTG